MNRPLSLLLLLLLLPPLAALLAGPLRPFLPDSLEAIRKRHGGPFLLVLWSLDCPPCRRELKLLGETRRAHPQLDVVLIATDDPGRTGEVQNLLRQYSLAEAESWIFSAANSPKLRHAVDPAWYGELPRSYFYLPDGSRAGHSGPLSPEQIKAWLEAVKAR